MDFKLNKNNLNFRVYTAAALPENGRENDICVISDVPMKNWILYPDKTSPRIVPRNDGDVWLRYSITDNTYNVLKNGTMMIAVISVEQYINGEWVDKTAKIYRNSEWTHLMLLTIAPNTEIAWTTFNTGQVTQNNGNTVFYASVGDGTKPYAYCSVDVTNYRTLKIVGDVVTTGSGSGYIDTTLAICDDSDTVMAGFNERIYGAREISIDNTYDISSLTGTYQFKFRIARSSTNTSHSCTLTATSIELY